MPDPFFSVLPGHDLAYTELVKPTRRWAFSYYFLYRWLPRLHPQQAMLIQVLRQCTWQGGRPTGRCQLANATLCRLMGWSETSHKTLLVELERPLSAWFVTRERTRKRHVTEGHAVEGAPRYALRMDDPLTPQDQAALGAFLATHHPASPFEAAELLGGLAGRHTRDLWGLLDAQPLPSTIPSQPATVAQLAATAWPHLDGTALRACQPFLETAERCQLRLVGAGYAHMELDYLLQGWLPHLGVNLTWLCVALRARCFHDPNTGEMRDTVVLSRRDLEAQLGIPTRTFRRMLRDEATAPLLGIAPSAGGDDAPTGRSIPHRGDLFFRIAYPLLPVCPSDQARYEALLFGTAKIPEAASFSTSGQRTPLKAASQPSSTPREIHKGPPNPAESGQPTRLNEMVTANRPGSGRPTDPAERERSGQRTPLEAANEPNIPATQINQLSSKEHTTLPLPLGREARQEHGDEIRQLLEPFGIQALPRILQNPTLTSAQVRGWILRGRDEVESAQMAGYLFRRLTPNPAGETSEPLPTAYLHVGEIEPSEACLFEDWWLTETLHPPFIDGAQRTRYSAWLQVIKHEAGDPQRPDFSPHALWRRELARSRAEV